MADSSRPLVTIVILNFNGKHVLEECLKAALGVAYSPREIILVDNGSTDGSTQGALAHLSETERRQIRIIETGRNLGYCDGFNVAMPSVRGKYVMFLNNDATIAEDSIDRLVEAMERDESIAMAEGKIINTAAEYAGMVSCPLGSFRLGFYSDGPEPKPGLRMYDDVRTILSPIGVWAIARVRIIRRIGAFDSNIFWGLDVRELAWRMWRTGFRVIRVPEAKAYHLGRLRTSLQSYPPDMAELMAFHSKKNQVYFLLKHISAKRLIIYLPITGILRLAEVDAALLTRQYIHVKASLRAAIWLVRNAHTVRAQRLAMKSIAVVPEDRLMRMIPKVSIGNLLLNVIGDRLGRT